MPYHYEIRLPVEVPDGPDGVEIAVEVARFPAMIDAINWGRRFPGSALFMVLEQDGVLDEVELPLKSV